MEKINHLIKSADTQVGPMDPSRTESSPRTLVDVEGLRSRCLGGAGGASPNIDDLLRPARTTWQGTTTEATCKNLGVPLVATHEM